MTEATSMPARERRRLYRRFAAGDARLDGSWYLGSVRDRRYCRSVCASTPPSEADSAFFRHPAQAEQSGYRPCPACRPELAPGDARTDVESVLARLVNRRIEDGAFDTLNLCELAAEFEVTEHALCAAVEAGFGVGPRDLDRTRRLGHARTLLRDTTLATGDIARATGLGSPQHLRSLIKASDGLSPSALRREHRRRAGASASATNDLRLRIDYRPPLNWPTLLAFLGARAIPGVEAAVGNSYRRSVRVGAYRGTVSVSPADSGNGLEVVMSRALAPVCIEVLSKLKTVFDTRANASEIDAHLRRDPLLAAAIAANGGMRLPGAFDGFELLLRAILGQQVSVKGATTLAGRMAAAFGEPLDSPAPPLSRLTPGAHRIADATVDQIAKIGMPGKRAETILTVARAVAAVDLVLAPGSDPEVVRARLIEVPGIGEWTASYVAMRALAWPDAMPHGDLGIKKALGLTRAADIIARTQAWRPYRAYGAIYLWLSLSGG